MRIYVQALLNRDVVKTQAGSKHQQTGMAWARHSPKRGDKGKSTIQGQEVILVNVVNE